MKRERKEQEEDFFCTPIKQLNQLRKKKHLIKSLLLVPPILLLLNVSPVKQGNIKFHIDSISIQFTL